MKFLSRINLWSVFFGFTTFFLMWTSGSLKAVAPSVTPSVELAPLSIEILPEDSYLVRGFHGRVRVLAQPDSDQLIVRMRQSGLDAPAAGAPASSMRNPLMRRHMDEWHFSLSRQGSVVELLITSPQSKDLWQKMLADESLWPRFDLEILAPSRPMDIVWRKGPIQVKGWQAPLNLHSQSGDVLVEDSQGALVVTHQMGSVKVLRHQGQVQMSTFNGVLSLERVVGRIEVENFSGETSVAQSEGEVILAGFEARQSVVGGSGRIEFNNQRSPLRVEGFSGELRGESVQGEVVASLRGEVNVRVLTKEAAVHLQLPGSGARVNIGSQAGNIQSPSFLRVDQFPNLRVARGRLRGSDGGQVYVRTESGAIRLN